MKKLSIFLGLAIFVVLLTVVPAAAGTKTVTLGWDYPTTVSDLAGFKVYQSSTSGQYDMTKPVTTVTDATARQTTLPSALGDGSYYWVLTAFDKSGNESVKSAELAYALDATAPPAPGALKVVTTVIVTIGQ